MAITLLVADDHEVVRSGVKSLVSGTDIKVVAEAATGEAAVRLTLKHKPDVALIDIRMPEGDGRLIIDLADTATVDSAGLGALMLIQRHAADRRQSVSLTHPSDEVRFLLMLTKLDELFESMPAGSAG